MIKTAFIALIIGGALAYGIIYAAQSAADATEISLMAASGTTYVTIKSPTASSTVASPVHFVVIAHPSRSIDHMAIYDGSRLVYNADVQSIDASIILPPGEHDAVKVQAWDDENNVFIGTTNFAVSTP